MDLKIGCVPVRVIREPVEDLVGEYESGPKPVIRLHPDLEGPGLASTLLHEVLHAIADMYGIDDVVKEREVRVLEMGLCQFLKDNPQTARDILNGLLQ
jgi:hypothetical protein